MLTVQEIQKMFAEMGLGSEKDREPFQEIGARIDYEQPKEQLFIRLSNTSEPSKKDRQDAELA